MSDDKPEQLEFVFEPIPFEMRGESLEQQLARLETENTRLQAENKLFRRLRAPLVNEYRHKYENLLSALGELLDAEDT